MPNVLTAAATVDCGHGGSVAKKSDPQIKLTVAGAAVLIEASLVNQPVTGCLTVPTGPPGPVSIQCLQCTGVTSAKSAKLTAHTTAVLLDPLAGQTNGEVSNVTPQTLLKATGVQTKLTAV
jgi:hypothetical protein